MGDPNAIEGSLRKKGYGPAKTGTEHEELSQRLMTLSKMQAVTFHKDLLFMEVDSPEDYETLISEFYPKLLTKESSK